MYSPFKFKKFNIEQNQSAMKVNTDGVLLGAWADLHGKTRVLDIGTGTGLLALMMAQRKADLHIDAVEIDLPSYEEASMNARQSDFANRIRVIHDSIQNFAMVHNGKYDLIVSNPPFFSGGTLSVNENKSRVRHTVKLSHSDLLSSVQKLMSQHGVFDVVLPYVEGIRFIEISRQYHLYAQKITEVRSMTHKSVERLLIRFSYQAVDLIEKNELIIQNSENPKDLTPKFIELVKEYYIFL